MVEQRSNFGQCRLVIHHLEKQKAEREINNKYISQCLDATNVLLGHAPESDCQKRWSWLANDLEKKHYPDLTVLSLVTNDFQILTKYGFLFSWLLLFTERDYTIFLVHYAMIWYVTQHFEKLSNIFNQSFFQQLFSKFSSLWVVLQQASWNWLFFHLGLTVPSIQNESQLACTSQLRQPIIFICLTFPTLCFPLN